MHAHSQLHELRTFALLIKFVFVWINATDLLANTPTFKLRQNFVVGVNYRTETKS